MACRGHCLRVAEIRFCRAVWEGGGVGGEPDRIRTCDPLIKSQLLYQLSYRPHVGGD